MIRALIALVLVALFLTGCALPTLSKTPPPLAVGLTGTETQKANAFDKRVKARFPLGSSVAALKKELTLEKFQIVPVHNTFETPPFEFIANRQIISSEKYCNEMWTVSWSESQGKITEIRGSVGFLCIS